MVEQDRVMVSHKINPGLSWAYDEDKLELIEERPANCVTIFLVVILGGFSFY